MTKELVNPAPAAATGTGGGKSGSAWARPVSLGRARVVSVPLALGASLGILGLAHWVGLPLLAGAALYLFFAMESDLRCARIPNWLNATGLLIAIAAGYFIAGTAGLEKAGMGALAGLLPGFALYACGAIGAGDAKGFAVLGALQGPAAVPEIYLYALAAGALFSLALLAYRGELDAFLARWAESLRGLVLSRRFYHPAPAPGSAAAGGFPFALCMAAGLFAQTLSGMTS
ncbi:MAG: prepilin peptidase [Myxococcota bacterium]|nr:prepilin peptidase [Myxococcota bacterium]